MMRILILCRLSLFLSGFLVIELGGSAVQASDDDPNNNFALAVNYPQSDGKYETDVLAIDGTVTRASSTTRNIARIEVVVKKSSRGGTVIQEFTRPMGIVTDDQNKLITHFYYDVNGGGIYNLTFRVFAQNLMGGTELVETMSVTNVEVEVP